MCVHNCPCARSCKAGGSAHSHHHASPCSCLLPTLTPLQASTALAALVGLPEPACPPSLATGSVGSPLTPTTRSSPCRCPHRPLGLAAGVRLLELLAKHLHLSTASFINIR